MLTTKQIENMMKHDRNFIGVYPIDRLPVVILPKPAGIIINLDESYKQGSHWVAVKFEPLKPGIYFDSFGRQPPEKIIAFMERNATSWIASDKIYQAEDTTLCGYYCILFLSYETKRFLKMMRSCDFIHNQNKIKIMFT